MAGAINIPVGLDINGVLSGFSTASTATTQFTSNFKEQLSSLKASTDAPINALSQLTRELTIAKRQIGDRLVVGADIAPDLAAKFAGLSSVVQNIKGALNTPISPFGDLNTRLDDTKARMQDILAVGGKVPDELTSEFRQLSGQVDAINRSFSAVPVGPFAALNTKLTETRTKMQDIVAAGGRIPTELTAELRDLESQVDRVNRSLLPVPTSMDRLVGMGDKLVAFGRTASLVTAGIVLLAGASFQSYAKINSLQLGLEAVTGSAAAAKEEFRQLLPIVRLPGLGLEEAVKGDVRLQAIGFSAREAKKDIAEIGNAIALTGGGKLELDTVLTQLTQMASKSKVLSEDLKPILSSSAAISKAVTTLFGSNNSEDISAKLQAAGKGPKDFINDLVLQLSTLERVKGGPANALENFGDSVKLAQFQIGEAADKSFDLTGKINKLGDVVGSMATAFAGAPGYIQTTTLTLVGIATAIPPVALGLGSLIKLAPIVQEGFGGMKTAVLALTTPIGIIGTFAAVVVGLGLAVYAANQPIVEMVDKTKLLNQLNQEAVKTIEAERSQVDRLLVTARNEQLSKDARLVAIKALNELAPEYLSNLTIENINSAQAAESIRKHAQAIDIRARARASEDKLVELYKKRDDVAAKPITDFERPFLNSIQTNRFNGLTMPTAVIDAPTKIRTRKLAESEKNAALSSIDQNIQDIIKLQADQKAQAVQFNVKLDPVVTKPTNYKDLLLSGDTQLKQDKDKLKKLNAEIYAGRRDGKDVSSQVAEYKTLKAQIDANSDSLKTNKKATDRAGDGLTTNERILKRLTLELKQNGDTADKTRSQRVALLQDAVALDNALANNKPVDIGKPQEIDRIERLRVGLEGLLSPLSKFPGLAEGLDDIRGFNQLGFYESEIGKIKKQIQELSLKNLAVPESTLQTLVDYNAQIEKANSALRREENVADFKRTNELPHFDIGNNLGKDAEGNLRPLLRVYDDTKKTLDQRISDLDQSTSTSLQTAAANLATGFGTLIGNMIAGTAKLSDLPVLLGSVFGELAKTMGSALIGFGTAGLAAKAFVTNPVGAIVAGIALTALGTALQASLQKSVGNVKGYESGGLFTGESFIRVGETSRARAGGGEFVAPVNLGADLISKRIMQNLGADFKRPQQNDLNQGRQIGITVGGNFEIRNDRLLAAVEAELEARGYNGPRSQGVVFNGY